MCPPFNVNPVTSRACTPAVAESVIFLSASPADNLKTVGNVILKGAGYDLQKTYAISRDGLMTVFIFEGNNSLA
jgi:hypothetical protein